MRTFFGLIALLFFAPIALAQGEFINKSTSIPPSIINTPRTNPTPNISINDPLPFEDPSKRGKIDQSTKVDMFQTSDFANPGDIVRDKLNYKKDNGEYKQFRRNQDLGNFKTGGKYAIVQYRDHQYVDGDRIAVYVNGKMQVADITLTADFQGVDIQLEPGFNKVDFVALNQGSSGPNTAEFRVVDSKGRVLSQQQWDLATGFKATVMIVKEGDDSK